MSQELSYATQTPGAAPEPPRLNFFNRLIGVYFSPGEAFEDVGRSAGIALPLIFLGLFTIVATVVTFNRLPMDKMMTQNIDRMVEEGRISPEQAEQQREQMRQFAPYMKIVGPVSAVLYILIFPLALAGIAKLVSMMMGVENKFLPLWSVTVYTILAVSLISSILFLILLYIKPVEDIDMNNPMGSNLAALLSMVGAEGLPKFVTALLTYVDIFYIWKVILLGIGYAAVSRKLKVSTAITVCGIGAAIFALGAAAWSSIFG